LGDDRSIAVAISSIVVALMICSSSSSF
jgi:hypothetical protein